MPGDQIPLTYTISDIVAQQTAPLFHHNTPDFAASVRRSTLISNPAYGVLCNEKNAH
jgi:hypothetical protein